MIRKLIEDYRNRNLVKAGMREIESYSNTDLTKLGYRMISLQEYESSIKAFEKALKILKHASLDSRKEATLGYAEALARSGDLKSAIKQYDIFLKKKQDDAELLESKAFFILKSCKLKKLSDQKQEI